MTTTANMVEHLPHGQWLVNETDESASYEGYRRAIDVQLRDGGRRSNRTVSVVVGYESPIPYRVTGDGWNAHRLALDLVKLEGFGPMHRVSFVVEVF